MSTHRAWVRLGSYLLAGGTATLLAQPAAAGDLADRDPRALQLGEAGEGGVLASPAGSAPRQEAERAVTALNDLAAALQALGAKLGVLVIVGG